MLSVLLTCLAVVPLSLANNATDFGAQYQPKARLTNETAKAIHIPMFYSSDRFRARVLVGENFTEFSSTIETGRSASWVTSWSGGGYNQKGQKLSGNFEQVQQLGD
jgi:hypothetical protein